MEKLIVFLALFISASVCADEVSKEAQEKSKSDLPDCETLNITDAQLNAATQTALQKLAMAGYNMDRVWNDVDAMNEVFRLTEQELGCRFPKGRGVAAPSSKPRRPLSYGKLQKCSRNEDCEKTCPYCRSGKQACFPNKGCMDCDPDDDRRDCQKGHYCKWAGDEIGYACR